MSPRISLTRHTAVGDIANLAAFVAPGQIFINEDLVRPVGRYFALKSLGEVPVKGKALPDAGSTLSLRALTDEAG